jgi:hypothetical protein
MVKDEDLVEYYKQRLGKDYSLDEQKQKKNIKWRWIVLKI